LLGPRGYGGGLRPVLQDSHDLPDFRAKSLRLFVKGRAGVHAKLRIRPSSIGLLCSSSASMIGAGEETRALFLFPSTTASRALRGTVMNRLSSRMLTALPDRESRAEPA